MQKDIVAVGETDKIKTILHSVPGRDVYKRQEEGGVNRGNRNPAVLVHLERFVPQKHKGASVLMQNQYRFFKARFKAGEVAKITSCLLYTSRCV